MKALLASVLTALVLVTAAWASNVTPAQLSALSQRVTKLEHANAALSRRVTAAEQQVAKTQASASQAADVVTCLQTGWNAQRYEPYLLYTSGGWSTLTGNLTTLVSPSAPDGLTGSGYLVESPTIADQC